MVTYADSSFLVSLYAQDQNTPAAQRYIDHTPSLIYLTTFSMSETQHAIRMLCFRKSITEADMNYCLHTFERDQEEGLYEFIPMDCELLFQKTAQLSHRYSLTFGLRYLDILHIACASLLKATHFLTFDTRQRKLAKAAGLRVGP